MQIEPERLVQILQNKPMESSARLLVLWYCVTGSRQEYRDRVQDCSTDPCLVPIILQGDGFTNANALLSDLNRLICTHELAFRSLPVSNDSPNDRVTILLLSKSEFGHPQTSSPTVLPEWFPLWGGQTQYVYIEDLARLADAFIDAPESHIDSIGNTLYYLESVMIERFLAVAQKDKNSIMPMFDVIRTLCRNKVDTCDDWLLQVKEYSRTLNPISYRPMINNKGSLIGCLVLIQQNTAIESIPRAGEKVLRSLGIDAESLEQFSRPKDSLFSVLLRPAGGDMDPLRRASRNLISTVFAASQFVTASHHAGEYDMYSVLLLRYTSFDIRKSLMDYIKLIQSQTIRI